MYIQNIQLTSKIPGFYSEKNMAVPFRQNIVQMPKPECTMLVNKYCKNFLLKEAMGQCDETMLQLSAIPLTILQKIAQTELNKMQNYASGKKLYIVTGRIGGGKSTFVEQNDFSEVCYKPDADEIKLLLPLYKEKGAEYVHTASCIINSTNISEALKRGVNTIIQTSTTIENIDDIIDEARDYGYKDIIMIHIDTKEETAIKRAEERGKITGRFVNPNEIKARKYIDTIVPTYNTPLKGLSQLIVYDNNGMLPIKIKDVNLEIPQENLTYITDNDK